MPSHTVAATTLALPVDFEDLQRMPAPDAYILAIIALSGKSHGAYYIKNNDSFRLSRQVSLEKAVPADFPRDAVFDFDNPDHIAIRNGQGEVKGFVQIAYADISQRYGRQFTADYLTPPPAMQEAHRAMANYMAQKFASALPPSAQRLRPVADETPRQRNNTLAGLARLLEKARATGGGLPDDNLPHGRGVAHLLSLASEAINQTAAQNRQAPPFDTAHKETLRLIGLLHDIGKVQIRMRSNYYQLREYLSPQDAEKPPEERAAIHAGKKEAWSDANYNHPVLGYMAVSCYPDFARTMALHHLSLFTALQADKREAPKPRNLVTHDITDPADIPFITQILRVSDVCDAIIGKARLSPAQMIEALETMTRDASPTGLPSIDPDIVCFMMDHGVFDAYLKEKTLPLLRVGDMAQKPAMTPQYQQAKAGMLERQNYAARKTKVEEKILAAMAQEPLLAGEQRLWEGRAGAPRTGRNRG